MRFVLDFISVYIIEGMSNIEIFVAHFHLCNQVLMHVKPEIHVYNKYRSLYVQEDVFLISSNAMRYNSPDTIYFRQVCAHVQKNVF